MVQANISFIPVLNVSGKVNGIVYEDHAQSYQHQRERYVILEVGVVELEEVDRQKYIVCRFKPVMTYVVDKKDVKLGCWN